MERSIAEKLSKEISVEELRAEHFNEEFIKFFSDRFPLLKARVGDILKELRERGAPGRQNKIYAYNIIIKYIRTYRKKDEEYLIGLK